MDTNSPMVLRYLIDALRQGSISPEPQAGLPQQQPFSPPAPTPEMLGTGGARGAAEAILRRRQQEEAMLNPQQ